MFGVTTSNLALADNVRLGWDPSPEKTVAGYRLRYGIAEEARTAVIDVGTNTTWVVSGLDQVCTNFFTVTAYSADGRESTASGVLAYKSTPNNQAPTATAATVNVPEDTTTKITLTGKDPEGRVLLYTLDSLPSHGKLTGTAPNLTYAPDFNYFGPDAFSFTVSDLTAWSKPAVVTLNVTPVNDIPMVTDRNVSVTEGDWNKVSLVSYDMDGDPLTYVVTSQPTHGVLSGAVPALIYTSTPGYSGYDYFTYSVTDGKSAPVSGKVTIRITHVNNPPSPVAQTLTFPEDTTKAITLTATDIDLDPITFSIGTAPTKGKLSGTPPNLSYTPNLNVNGTDTFTFLATDSYGAAAEGMITLKITAVNDAPVAKSGSVTVQAGKSVTIPLIATDVDKDTLVYTVPRLPSSGTLSGSGTNRTYTPTATSSTTDSFDFLASDGKGGTSLATITVTIQGTTVANRAPSSTPLSLTVREDNPLSLTLAGTDPDGNTLTYVITRAPAKGTLSGKAPALVYTPNANFNGTDSFEYTVSDGSLTSAGAVVTIVVTPENDAPSALASTVTVLEDHSAEFELAAVDVDGDALTYVLDLVPEHGTLSGTLPKLRYTPNPNYNGTDRLTFSVKDATSASATVTVDFTVVPENDLPLAQSRSLRLGEDSTASIRLEAVDVDNDPVRFEIVGAPAHGSLSGEPPNVVYTPEANYSGTDSFTFVARDVQGTSSPATVSLEIVAINDAPVALPATLTVEAGTPLSLVLTGRDPENDSLHFVVVTPPQNGTLTGEAPNLIYTPKADFAGTDSLVFRANDGQTDSEVATVTFTVQPSSRPPLSPSPSFTTAEDTTLPITLPATADDGAKRTYTLVQGVEHGKLLGTLPTVSYRPATNYFGTDAFTVAISDGVNPPTNRTFSITVTPVNDAPVVQSKTLKIREDTAQNFFLSANDAEGDAITYTITAGPENGTVTGTPPALLYRPNPNFYGTDVIRFTASDSQDTSREATFTFTVTPVNDAPVAVNSTVIVRQNVTTRIALIATDPEQDPLTLVLQTLPLHGVLTGEAPNLTYTPATDYLGTDTFTFVAKDAGLSSKVATVTLTVTEAAAAPTTLADRILVAQGGSVHHVVEGSTNLLANDTPNGLGEIQVRLERAPEHGTVTLAADGTFEYTHLGDTEATDTFRYIASVEGVDSAPTEVTVQVLRAVELVRTEAGLELSFTVAAGLEYQVEINDTADADAAAWVSLGQYQPDADGIATITDAEGQQLTTRHYRVRGLAGDQSQRTSVLSWQAEFVALP